MLEQGNLTSNIINIRANYLNYLPNNLPMMKFHHQPCDQRNSLKIISLNKEASRFFIKSSRDI